MKQAAILSGNGCFGKGHLPPKPNKYWIRPHAQWFLGENVSKYIVT